MLKSKNEIQQWLDKMEIEDYTINEDLTVDVDGNVDLVKKGLTELPIQFGKVTGDFDCYSNNLESLKGSPKVVEGGFDCSHNQLTTLEGCPEIVEGWFYCEKNNLTSFEYLPLSVGGYLIHDGIEEQGITESATLEELHQRNEIIKSKQTLEAELNSKDLTKEEVKRPKMKI